MHKRNLSIEAMRAVACIFVALCHYTPDNALGEGLAAVGRFGVPFFLLVSGFYANRGSLPQDLAGAKRRLAATWHLTLWGIGFCAVLNSVTSLLWGDGFADWLIPYLNGKSLLLLLVFGRANWLSAVMYYLFNLLYVYIIFLLLCRWDKVRWGTWAVPVLLVVNLLLGKLPQVPWYAAGNAFLTGFPFFMAGYQLAEMPRMWAHPRLSCTAAAAGVVLSLAEYVWNPGGYCYVGSVLIAAGLFTLCQARPQNLFPQWLSRFGGRFGVPVFLLHLPLGGVIFVLVYRLTGLELPPEAMIPAVLAVILPGKLLLERVQRRS